MLSLYLFLPLLVSATVHPFFPYKPFQTITTRNDTGEPLYLTPLIEAGKLDEAKNLSRVVGLMHDIPAHSGYLTVNKEHNSNMFFWFFPAKHNPQSAPVLLWLQGGPGASSLFGLFYENGPYIIERNEDLKLRDLTWTHPYNVLYFDNPVGTGFSFTDSDDGYAKNETDVARDLFEALQQFFTLFSEYQQNEFYVTGESYAGKYAPAIGYKIHESMASNEADMIKLNFKGIAVGNGLTDPVHMMDYGVLLYEIGLLGETEKEHYDNQTTAIVNAIKAEKYTDAFYMFAHLMNYFTEVTGSNNPYNFINFEQIDTEPLGTFLNMDNTRKALHVGNKPFNSGEVVERHLIPDVMMSVVSWLETLMEHYKVMYYNGQLDIIVAYALTESMFKSLEWSGAAEYQKAPRKVWKVGTRVAGYAVSVKDFRLVLVRDASHLAPHDQPAAILDMLGRFITNKPF